MCFQFFRRRVANNYQLFDARYIDPKGLFLHFFNEIPSVSYITDINMKEAYPFIRNQVNAYVRELYQHSQFNYETEQLEFNVTFLLLHTNRLIEIGTDYIAVFHGRQQADWAARLIRDIANFRINKPAAGKIGFNVQNELN